MNALVVLFVAGLALVSCQEKSEEYKNSGKGPYFGAFHGPYGYGGLHPAAVRNDFRQLAVNNIAESVGAGIGNAKEDGVPGSAIYNYDNVPYPAYPAAAYPAAAYPAYAPYGFPYAGAGFYGAGGYGFPYHFPAGYYNGAATVVNTKPVHYEAPAPAEPAKSVDPQH